MIPDDKWDNLADVAEYLDAKDNPKDLKRNNEEAWGENVDKHFGLDQPETPELDNELREIMAIVGLFNIDAQNRAITAIKQLILDRERQEYSRGLSDGLQGNNAIAQQAKLEVLEKIVSDFSGEHQDSRVTRFVQTELQDYLAKAIKEVQGE